VGGCGCGKVGGWPAMSMDVLWSTSFRGVFVWFLFRSDAAWPERGGTSLLFFLDKLWANGRVVSASRHLRKVFGSNLVAHNCFWQIIIIN